MEEVGTEDEGGLSGYESDDELDEEEDEEDEEGEGSGRPKNDPEWQFFDTAKVFVKGGDGGELLCGWHVFL